ncbi:MAG: hypothetical protein U9P49_08610 [Thermodesulfobacteriota bacterium]|nr:hypothetical protein [Thermodesulfobacteriota bacterium]
MGIKRVSSYLFVIIMMFALALAGCDERHDVTRGSEDSFGGLNSEELLSSEDYTNLGNLLGNLTGGELMDILDESLQTLNALGAQGKTSPEDYETLLCIITNMYNNMAADKAEFEETGGAEGAGMAEASDALIALIDMMAENKVGDVLNDLLKQTGPDVLTENIYPMLEYLMAADTATLEGAVGGISLGGISEEGFNSLMGVAKIALGSEMQDVLGELMEDDSFKEDLEDLLYSAGKLMTEEKASDPFNEWDKYDMADFERILYCTEDLIDVYKENRGAFEEFVGKALVGIAPTSDGETLRGLLKAIATMDRDYIPDIDTGLLHAVRRNMYAGERSSQAVKTSSLRALIFMMHEADVDFPSLKLVTYPGGTVSDITTNIAEWTVGEVVTARNPNMTLFEAFDGVLFKKKYKILGIIPPDGFDGLVGMMGSPLVKGLMPSIGIIDPFPAFIELAGGDDSVIWFNRYGTAGERHTLFALFAPLMEYFWHEGRPGDMIGMLANMNEIEPDDYVPLFDKRGNSNPDATFKVDDQGVVLKAIEGPYGYGLLTYALRGMSDEGDDNDGDILDPILDLTVMVLNKLISTEYSPGLSLFDALLDELGLGNGLLKDDGNIDYEAIDDIVSALFEPDENGEYPLDKVQTFLKDNHDTIVNISEGLGNVLLIAGEAVGEPDNTTIQGIIDKLEEIKVGSLGELIDYLLEEKDGSDNPFVSNVKVLAYKMLDIKHDDYNPNGNLLPEETTLTELFDHLIGDENSGIYDFSPMMDFLVAVTDNPDLLWALTGSDGDAEPEEGLLTECPGISIDFIKALFASVDVDGDGVVDDSVTLGMMKLINLDVGYNGLLHELVDLLSGADLKPDGDTYNMILNALELVVENSYING